MSLMFSYPCIGAEEYLLLADFGSAEISRVNLDGSQLTTINNNGTGGVIQLDFDIR